MRRAASILVVILAVAGVGWLGLRTVAAVTERNSTDVRRSRLPDVDLLDVDSKIVSLSSQRGRAMVLIYFLTTCEYCMSEINQLKGHPRAFAGMDLILISPEDRNVLREFNAKIGADDSLRFQVLQDVDVALGRIFKIRRVPTTLIYHRDGSLARQFEGLAPVDRILQAIEASR